MSDVASVSSSETTFIPANRASSCRCKAFMSRIKLSALFSPTTSNDQCSNNRSGSSGRGAETLADNTPQNAEGSTNRGTTRGAGGASQTQDQRFFDVTHDRNSLHFHPNVQGAYNHQNVLEYISKHGDYTEWGEFRERSRCANHNNKDNIYRDALAAGTKDEALAVVRNGDPKCFWLNYDKLSSNYDRISFNPPLPYVYPFTDTIWVVPAAIQQWVADNIRDEAQRPHRPKSIIIEGPSRIGKTCWARSLGPHNYYSGHIDLRDHKNDAFYNIIDDVAP
ncbi:hypothetical protein HYC85_027674 [Camellia sinensis]|uniref:Geminivirus AL1 replication-associated protein catalytic domain-containing protein n=1 Tax=Camellia sinensis TaxID=4442 RepID=A0A7J7FSY6_CAMSI|nr:hypothetical protein HYC85_027674 [Camellia sinensis]